MPDKKYVIGGLKDLALLEQHGMLVTFSMLLASLTPTSTIDTDRGLRDIILEVFSQHKDLLDRDDAKLLIKRQGSRGSQKVHGYPCM
ncbi:hypothetical protein CCHL11_06876 [Colletotrichum chlorophyti]|uniref:Uncharacterized protein n=1 Tax=Colletotrichum chlorophyti TaxID=708187 RepID=A0A1Q8S9F4_9PEZI|nr:hypothetical protein CCHL11_06876 [Colletotrichum chlorophyti]